MVWPESRPHSDSNPGPQHEVEDLPTELSFPQDCNIQPNHHWSCTMQVIACSQWYYVSLWLTTSGQWPASHMIIGIRTHPYTLYLHHIICAMALLNKGSECNSNMIPIIKWLLIDWCLTWFEIQPFLVNVWALYPNGKKLFTLARGTSLSIHTLTFTITV